MTKQAEIVYLPKWGMGYGVGGYGAWDMGHGTRDIRYGALGMGNGSSGEAVFF